MEATVQSPIKDGDFAVIFHFAMTSLSIWPPLPTYNSNIPEQPAPALQRSFKEALVAAVYVR